MATNLLGASHIGRYAFPFQQGGSDVEASRAELYKTLEGYYYNSIFEDLGLAALDPALADVAAVDTLRGIYNPVTAIVDAYANWTLQGKLGLPDDAGAEVKVRAKKTNPKLAPAIQTIWGWSNLESQKEMLPRYAANLGDALLLATGRPDAPGSPGKVWVEVRHPGIIKELDRDDRGNIVYAHLEETREEPRTVEDAVRAATGAVDAEGRSYTWSAIYTKTEFATFRDGKPWDYAAGDGGPGYRWPNGFGFVPMVLVPHKNSGGDWGLNAYHASISVINELCLEASEVGQLIGQWLAPQWAIFGVGRMQDKVRRDGPAWLFDEAGGDAKALTANVDVAGAYVHIEAELKWLADRQPELALSRAREANLQTGAAIRAMLFETVKGFEQAQDNYDAGLIRVLQMALTMAQTINAGNRPLSAIGTVGKYEDGDLDFTFDRPDVLPVSKLEAAQAAADMASLQRQSDLQAATTQPADATQAASSLIASRLLAATDATVANG